GLIRKRLSVCQFKTPVRRGFFVFVGGCFEGAGGDPSLGRLSMTFDGKCLSLDQPPKERKTIAMEVAFIPKWEV
ncbi:hypothetical protein, partial [Agrobacterium sp. DSM 25558]|uniref:hypothetical protein n=1 Tax=Agrobacterium sp. DSM 25558 TaxID=1907665 RepID=UPI001AEC7E4D